MIGIQQKSGYCILISLIKLLMIFSVFIATTSCLGQFSAPQNHYYRLPPLDMASKKTKESSIVTIAVAKPHAEGMYQNRSIVFSFADQNLELHRYHYQHWIKAPAYIIQDSLVEYLRYLDISRNVHRYQPGKSVEIKINVNIVQFEQLISEGNNSALVALEFVIDSDGWPTSSINKIFKSEVQAKGTSLYDTIVAFGQALNNIYSEFSQELYPIVKSIDLQNQTLLSRKNIH